MLINALHTANLRNDEHFQFHTEFRGLAVKFSPETLKIGTLFNEYLPLYDKVDEALKKIVKSAVTEKIHDADGERDEIWRGLVHTNYAALKDFDPEVRETAKNLKVVFDTYGNLAKKPINEKTAAIYNILQELQGKYAEHCKTIRIDRWANELQRLNTAVSGLINERSCETAMKTDIILRQARMDIDKAYRAIIKRIDAYAETEGIGSYEEFVKNMNVIIARYAMALAVRTGRHAARKCVCGGDHGDEGSEGADGANDN